MTPEDKQTIESLADALQQIGDGLHAISKIIDRLLVEEREDGE